MKRIYGCILILMVMALTACSKGNYRIKEIKSDNGTSTYEYYDSGKLKSIAEADADGTDSFIKEFSEDGKLTRIESLSDYYPKLEITGNLSYTRYDTEAGLDCDSDFYLREDGQTDRKVQRYSDRTVTTTYVYDENGVCQGIKTDADGEEEMKITYEYDYDSNGNPVKRYQIRNGNKTELDEISYEKY